VKRVAIVGGGLAGLSCAYSLKVRGIDTTIFDAASKPGGRDTAAFYLLAPDLFRNTFHLIDRLGLAGEIIAIPPHAGRFTNAMFITTVLHPRPDSSRSKA
jgi:2,4-dienoyl-CoA reductase (NADPH2)